MKGSRNECSCRLDVEPVHVKTGSMGQVVCAGCGQVWVPPGWQGDRVPLFPESTRPADSHVPSADDLDLWYRLDRASP